MVPVRPSWRCRLLPVALGLLPVLAAAQQPVAAGAVPASPAAVDTAALGPAFETRNAVFDPVPFEQMPGWTSDTLHESADGMRASCKALRRKVAWSATCADFDTVDGSSDAALRGFFQRHFYAYRIMSPARQPDGLITGYFEPLLDGRTRQDAQYRFPVYGLPRDLLLLDAALNVPGQGAWLKVQGNRLVAADPGTPGAAQYTLALDAARANIRDKRLRVRLDGATVRPYWTRQEIEQRALDAPVLAWVAEPQRLYSMQIQGSGKIRLEDGALIRVSVVEQNGQPFLPNITRGVDTGLVLQAIKTRGLRVGAAAGATALPPDPAVPAAVNDEVSQLIAQLSGRASAPAGTGSGTVRPSPSPVGQSPAPRPRPRPAGGNGDVQAMIAALLGNAPPPAAAAPRPSPRPSQAAPQAPPATGDAPASLSLVAPAAPVVPAAPEASGSGAPAIAAVAASGAAAESGIPDPSYIFFRNTGGDGPQGPIGALGVPLSAGRSLAVDPRSTPLGSPVFISTTDPSSRGRLQRLMFAQDTGGAIRGSVRGDLFWGFGDSAGRLALATNDTAQMWLLLPREQALASAAARPVTRSLKARAALPDCVVDDPDLCVEE